jgi:hypothetical protein
VDNIKTDLAEIGWGSVDWIDLAHGSLLSLSKFVIKLSIQNLI